MDNIISYKWKKNTSTNHSSKGFITFRDLIEVLPEVEELDPPVLPHQLHVDHHPKQQILADNGFSFLYTAQRTLPSVFPS